MTMQSGISYIQDTSNFVQGLTFLVRIGSKVQMSVVSMNNEDELHHNV
jgi:hypothetical protein